MLMALFQNKESLSSNKTTRVCGQADKNVQLQARPRGLIGVRRDFNLLLHPIVIRRLTLCCHAKKIGKSVCANKILFQCILYPNDDHVRCKLTSNLWKHHHARIILV